MLAKDVDARDCIRREKETGEIGQWRASIELGTPVVERLVACAEKADRSSADHYAIALARARDAAANGFFREVLKGKDWENRTTARFFSALTLAEQGDGAGIEWLIANCEDHIDVLTSAKPSRAGNLNLGVCCIAALQALAGKEELKTKADFDAWWRGVEKPFVPKAHVLIVDP
jgi:hypothetical protein